MLTITRKAVNYVKARTRRLLTGAHDVDDATFERRLALCQACPFFSGGPTRADWSCIHEECGCVLEAKNRWASESCPIGQWGQMPTAPADFGVVIGSYGWPSLIELQIRLLKDMCGEFPILIVDDATPGADFEAMVAKYQNVSVWRAKARMGHYGGDLAVFDKGVTWAKTNGLRWLVKLSQRFMVTREGWIQDGIAELKKAGKPVLGQRCWDDGGGTRNRTELYVRSECLLMDVDAWATLNMVSQLSPTLLHNPTELRIWHIVVHFLGGADKMHLWNLLKEDRYHDDSPGILFHATHGPAAYRALFEQYALRPDASMMGDAWVIPPWKKG